MATKPHNSDDSSIDMDLVEKYVTEDGSTIQTRETNDGTVEEQCPNCGNWYSGIGIHWSRSSSCDYVPIEREKFEMFKGLMLGDGSIANRKGKNCTFRVSNTNKRFLQYLDDKLGWLSNQLVCESTAQEVAERERERGFSENVRAKERCDQYVQLSRTHPIFNTFRNWWGSNELIFPKINYSSELLRMWYISDAHLSWSSSGSSYIIFSSRNESDRPNNIIDSFGKIGFTCSNGETNTYNFRLPVDQTEDFFDYIGHDPVPGFEYKWAWQNRECYDYLKKACDHVYKTKTLE